MKNIKLYLSIGLLICLFTNCYKDQGNYDYTSLDEIIIDTTVNDIKNSYSLYRYDTLKIVPKITLNNQEITNENDIKNKLSFTWSIYQANIGGGIHSRDTLSNTIALNSPIKKPSGSWIILLTVKDLETKTETYQKFNVQVDESISDGWMVLYEKDGNTDLGLIVDNRIKTGVLKDRIFTDLLKNTNGYALEGKPVSVLQSGSALISREVIVASEKNMEAYLHTNMSKAYPFDKLFYTEPTNKSLTAFSANNARKEFVINNNKLHTNNFSSSTSRTIYFGTDLLGQYGELEAWEPKFFAQGFDAVAYDKTNKKFKYVVANTIQVIDFPAPALATAEWDPRDVGLDLKAYDYGRNNYEYLIMSNNQKTYLLTANFMATNANAVALKKYDISHAPDINNLSAMASASSGSYILYGANDKMYVHSYDSNNAIQHIWTAPSGEKITSIRLAKFYFTTVQTVKMAGIANQYVYIATYNESTKEGKIYNLKIDQTNGQVDSSTQKIYTGFGKIKDMNYKWIL